eukprot:3270725-Prymnesium_polylepis.2
MRTLRLTWLGVHLLRLPLVVPEVQGACNSVGNAAKVLAACGRARAASYHYERGARPVLDEIPHVHKELLTVEAAQKVAPHTTVLEKPDQLAQPHALGAARSPPLLE